jgi:hypothetical protein
MRYAFPRAKKFKIRPPNLRYWNREEHELLVDAIESGIYIGDAYAIAHYMNYIKTPRQIRTHTQKWRARGYAPQTYMDESKLAKLEFMRFMQSDEELETEKLPDPELALAIFPEFYDHYYVPH